MLILRSIRRFIYYLLQRLHILPMRFFGFSQQYKMILMPGRNFGKPFSPLSAPYLLMILIAFMYGRSSIEQISFHDFRIKALYPESSDISRRAVFNYSFSDILSSWSDY